MSRINYNKEWVDYDGLLDILIDRGMAINDAGKAKKYLSKIGYYRLSGYWYCFRPIEDNILYTDINTKKQKYKIIRSDTFIEGTSFQNIIDIYIFDKKLRILALDALERVEISVRAEISHYLGEKSIWAYTVPDTFHESFVRQIKHKNYSNFDKWHRRHKKLLKHSRQEAIAHHQEKYIEPAPIWVASECWDFGAMSKLYGGMKSECQDAIAQKYGISDGRIFATWLRTLNLLRNISAHHNRLWNKNFDDKPRLPKESETIFQSSFEHENVKIGRCYIAFCILAHFLSVINPSSSWKQRFNDLIVNEFPKTGNPEVSLQAMGITDDWETHGWKKKSPAQWISQ